MSTTTNQQSPSRNGKADTVSERTTSTATTVVAPNDPLNSSPQSKQDNSLENENSLPYDTLTQTDEEEAMLPKRHDGIVESQPSLLPIFL